MTDASFGSLVVRMLISLAIVFALIGGGYVLMRRRQNGGGSAPRLPRSPMRVNTRSHNTIGSARSRRTPRTNAVAKGAGQRRALRVVGRITIGRSTQMVAVQFAEQVYLVAASEHGAPTVITQVPLDEWLEATDEVESVIPLAPELVAIDGGAEYSAPRSFVDALREATVRRA
jgi:flagellar biogenesis protein FliO